MRTIKSALFIALCLLFATYATALRKHFPRGPKHATKFIRPIRPTRPMADRTLPYKPWNPPPFVQPMADRAQIWLPEKPWTGTPPYNPFPKYELYADSEVYPPRGGWIGSTGPYNPIPRPMPFSDSQYKPARPDWIGSTGPYNPGPIIKGPRPDILFSDADLSILPYPTKPTKPTKPWIGTTGPYAPTIQPLTTFDDEEDFDEEDFGINGSISNGGNWNLGGSYSGNIGRNGNWNVGGSVGNGGQWGVNAGLTWRF